MLQCFPLTELPAELALEIIRHAASSVVDEKYASPRSYYATAVALATVSYTVRQATMPHLLNTVILRSSRNVVSFIQSILLQKSHRRKGSRLALRYSQLVRRFWSTECWEPLVDERPEKSIDCSLLHEIIRGVDSLGIHFKSMYLLYTGLGKASNPSWDWSCTRVTLAGSQWRWKPFTSSHEGVVFLSKITHLMLWIPYSDPYSPSISQSHRNSLPSWMQDVPFALMPNLTHLACPAQLTNGVSQTTALVVYIASPAIKSVSGPNIFQQWILETDPLKHGIVFPLHTHNQEDLALELMYLCGENDRVWLDAEKARRTRNTDSNMMMI